MHVPILQLYDICVRGLRDTHTLIQGRESMAPSSTLFFPMHANRLHFCNRKISHGYQEATTSPAQTFALWTPAQTVRHSLLSWGRSPSPTPTVPSSQSLPGGEAYHSSCLDKAPSTLQWLTVLFCDKKQQIRFVSLMDFDAHCRPCRSVSFLL